MLFMETLTTYGRRTHRAARTREGTGVLQRLRHKAAPAELSIGMHTLEAQAERILTAAELRAASRPGASSKWC